ncbi:MAG: UDP-glucose 4-epimerase GalE [Opitutales bacterium]
MKVLVVGGAGYIGSHCVRQLSAQGYEPVVLDNLVYGHRKALEANIPFYEGDLGSRDLIRAILRRERIEAVMHFAAYTYVDESVTEPIRYYENNLIATLRLLEVMISEDVKRFIFSSTCATYGVPETLPITEDEPQAPINPYGQTKLDVERALQNYAGAYGLSFAAFRYFNAAGAAEDGSIGEDHEPETHLIPLVIDAAMGKRDNIKIFGTDYDTPDGTCLRDYIHVDDLSRAHIAVIEKLAEPGQTFAYNLGVGKPYSVREIIESVERVSGKTVPVAEAARRPGDPPALYADNTKAVRELGWKIKYDQLDAIIETAWRWHAKHPDGFAG